MWLLFAFLAPMFYGVANVFDNFLVNKSFKNPATLAFYASLFSIIFVPFLLFFYKLSFPPISLIPIFLLLGIINVSYLYPYYKGLQSDDTSTAVSFFSLGRIFILIWAFFIVGEKLSTGKYIGVALIVIGTILLSVKGKLADIKLSKALFYILFAAFIISFEAVLMKYLFNHGVSVGVGVAGEMIASFVCALLFLLKKNTRTDIVTNFSTFKTKIPIFFVEEGATFLAFFTGSYALGIAPVSLVKSITIFSPFFVLMYAKLLGKKFPHFFNEQKGVGITLKKIFLFSITAIGVLLIAQ
jgi:drug/metabolite transporter (DMT)-like permease